MSTGIVKFFNTDKGFGFIIPEGGSTDLFFHITGYNGEEGPSDGMKVTYDVSKGKKGPYAANVQAA